MLNTVLRSSLIVGGIATLAAIVGVSVAMEANLSTTALLLALGLAPAIVMVLMANGAASPTVAQILYAVETQGPPIVIGSRAGFTAEPFPR